MNKLTLGVEFEDHVFKLEKYRHTICCFYEVWLGNYCGCIEFKNKNTAFVEYKNIRFYGQVTSTKNWFIHIIAKNYSSEIMKNGNSFVFNHEIFTNPYYKPQFDFSSIIANLDNGKTTTSVLGRSKILEILEKCKKQYKDLYKQINNKQEFEQQLSEIIKEDFCNSENEQDFIGYAQNYFKSCLFIENLNVDYVFYEFPKLKQQNIDSIKLSKFISELFDYSDIDMWPETLKEDLYEAIIDEFALERQQDMEENNKETTLEQVVHKTWENKVVDLKQQDEFWGRMHYLMHIGEIKEDSDVIIKGQEILNNCIIFEKEMEQYLSLWGNYKVITINGDKKHRFESLNKDEMSKEEQQEYELIYKVVMPTYTQCLYNKKTKKLKTIIQKFPDFITNTKYIVQLMLKYNLLTEKQDYIQLGTTENIQSFLNELYKPQD